MRWVVQAKVLMAINWSRPEDVAEAHRMLTYWTPLSPIEALEVRLGHLDAQCTFTQR